MRTNFEDIYAKRKQVRSSMENHKKNDLISIKKKNAAYMVTMKKTVEEVMLKRAENKEELRAFMSNEACKLFFAKHKDQLTNIFNYYYSQTYLKLGQHKIEKISLKQFKKFTMDFELVPLVISGKELSTIFMSSIYDNKENIKSDTTHVDYEEFVEV